MPDLGASSKALPPAPARVVLLRQRLPSAFARCENRSCAHNKTLRVFSRGLPRYSRVCVLRQRVTTWHACARN